MGRFRRDLLYRLEGIKLSIPPLRERPQDIPAIARYYLEKRSDLPCEIAEDAQDVLRQYSWPGNIRQLLNVLNQTVALHECKVIRAEHLPSSLRDQPSADANTSRSKTKRAFDIDHECQRFVEAITRNVRSIDGLDFEYLVKRIKQLEREVAKTIIEKGLTETKGNRQLLSEKLNISKRSIRYILNEKADFTNP